MQAWWRVLRGVWPYRWSVIISMVCAIGVGLSYASGVAVMLPVMKIFISEEGLQGWANRTAAESRLDVTLWDLGTNIRYSKTGLRAIASGKSAPQALQIDHNAIEYITIIQARAPVNGKILSSSATNSNEQWQQLVSIIAHADRGSTAQLDLQSNSAAAVTQGQIALHDPSWLGMGLVALADFMPKNPTNALAEMVAFFIFLCIVGSVFRYYQQFLGMNVANRVILDLRRRMYDRVVALPTSFFAQKGTSDLMSRLTTDTGTLTDGVSMAFGKAVQEPVKAFASLVAALYIDWRLTFMIIFSVPFLALIIRKFSKHMRKASRRALESSSKMLSIINETLIGARVVKAYSAEGFERRRFARVNKQLLKEQFKLNHYNALSRPVIETLAVVVTSIPLLFAVHWVLQGKIDREKFFTLLALFGAMLEPLRKLADVNSRVQQSNAAATRVFEVVDMDVEPNASHSLPKLPRHQHSIEFRDITFSYPGHDEVVLRHVNVLIEAGKNVAVVGGNGSGKTTLLQLLPRLYVALQGQVLIDGIDTAGVSLRSLRKQIGLVTQDTLLFADTIYNNIAYGARHATREQVMDAAKRAFADEFISNLPQGYDTLVGEHGVRLSGGQKQRIAIARAILHDPAILILDEAMSQIDSDSEMKISAALREFTKNRTTLMIAHRFQTVISADMIVCLDAGKVEGIGTHQHLIATCAAYRKLYENQFREVAEISVMDTHALLTPATR